MDIPFDVSFTEKLKKVTSANEQTMQLGTRPMESFNRHYSGCRCRVLCSCHARKADPTGSSRCTVMHQQPSPRQLLRRPRQTPQRSRPGPRRKGRQRRIWRWRRWGRWGRRGSWKRCARGAATCIHNVVRILFTFQTFFFFGRARSNLRSHDKRTTCWSGPVIARKQTVFSIATFVVSESASVYRRMNDVLSSA